MNVRPNWISHRLVLRQTLTFTNPTTKVAQRRDTFMFSVRSSMFLAPETGTWNLDL
jgi:hypothetical protein